MSKRAEIPWSVPIAIHEVPETGRRLELSADAQTRAGVAAAAGLRSLPRLEASFDVSRHGREGLRVVGQISATVGQVCVVTLEPIESTVEEQVDLVFAPPPPVGADQDGEPKLGQIEDAPEPLINGTLDLGLLATEFLMLGIDPYPRKPGATFETPAAADDGNRPFAALAALKRRPGQS
jgi:hypothetical protein